MMRAGVALDPRRLLLLLVVIVWVVSVLFATTSGKRYGEREAREEAGLAIAKLEKAQSDLRAQAAEQNLLILQQQIARADAAEKLWLQAQQDVAALQSQLKERIPNVTTVYRPAPAAEPVPIPRCVFTRGWLRDFNTALGGADLPGATAGPRAGIAAAAEWPAPGSPEELLESGVTPADVLAFAQDYGRWSLGNLARLYALQSLHNQD